MGGWMLDGWPKILFHITIHQSNTDYLGFDQNSGFRKPCWSLLENRGTLVISSHTHTHRFKADDWWIVGRFSPFPLWSRPTSLCITTSSLGERAGGCLPLSLKQSPSLSSLSTRLSVAYLGSLGNIFFVHLGWHYSGHTEEASWSLQIQQQFIRRVRDRYYLQHCHDITKVLITCHT